MEIEIPTQFRDEFVSSSSADFEALISDIRALWARGIPAKEIVERSIKCGWSEAFSNWLVNQVYSAGRDEINFVVSPAKVYKSDLDQYPELALKVERKELTTSEAETLAKTTYTSYLLKVGPSMLIGGLALAAFRHYGFALSAVVTGVVFTMMGLIRKESR